MNDWNAQRTVTLIVEALADLNVELWLSSEVVIKRDRNNNNTIRVTVEEVNHSVLILKTAIIDDNNQDELNALHDAVMKLFPSRQSDEMPF